MISKTLRCCTSSGISKITSSVVSSLVAFSPFLICGELLLSPLLKKIGSKRLRLWIINGVSLSRIWGNKFHVEANYKPWKFPLDVVPMIQNARGYPTTQSSAIMDFPRPQKVRKKKKGLGAVSIVLLVGGLALLGTFFAVFAVRMSHHRRSPNLAASQRSSNSTTYSLPVSTNRGDLYLSLP